MAKKAKTAKLRAEKYDEKTVIVGSFKDLMKAAVKDAKAKTGKKKP
jgi:hypothetical protein